MTAQDKMDAAVDSYLQMADVLSSDVNAVLDQKAETEAWRRTFVRTVAALVVGDNFSISQMAAIGLETDASKLSPDEVKALTNEKSNSSTDQIKYVLRSTYKMFELEQPPDFRGKEWGLAKKFMDKRNKVMHPKSVADLHISKTEWDDLFEGAKWLIAEHFALIAKMHKKYG